MYSSKLISVLKKLSIKERKKLYDFIESPYFAVPKEVQKLFHHIQPYLQDWENENWQKKHLFAHLYPNEPFHAPKINKLLSRCLDTFEQFYCIYHLKTNSIYTLEPLFDFYSEHQLSSLFDGLYRATCQNHANQYRDNRYYHERWELDKLLAYRENNQYVRQEMQSYIDSILSLESFFIIEQLRTFCQNFIFKGLFTNFPPNSFEESVIKYIESNQMQEKDKVIKLYWLIYKAFNGEYHFYTVILDILPDYSDLLTPFEIRAIYSYLESILIEQRRSPHSCITYNEVLVLYKHQLASGYIFDQNGNIPPGAFKNIVSVGLMTNEEPWTWDFITTFEHRLPANMQKEVGVLCKALWHFASQNYTEVLRLLNTYTSTDVFFNINTRRLWVQTYCELWEDDLAINQLNTFHVYIHRSKHISSIQKESNSEFIKILKKIIATEKPAQLAKIKDECSSIKHIAEKSWLLKQIECRIHKMNQVVRNYKS